MWSSTTSIGLTASSSGFFGLSLFVSSGKLASMSKYARWGVVTLGSRTE